MQHENRLAFNLTIIATILVLFVMMLGAYTRLKDAGLGCPDWPGCYGQVIAPNSPSRVLLANEAFPNEAIDTAKAWTEMAHRYAAGTLGLLILVITILTLRKHHLHGQPIALPLALVALVIFQALLGKWTVTMRLLPVVVMTHLMCGMLIMSLLWVLAMRLGDFFHRAPSENVRVFKPWAAIAIIIVALQIFLGGWTSSNYAALICPDFPYCQGKLLPAMDLHRAFHFWMSTGPNYQGGILGNTERVTIQVMHRLGALVTVVYLCWLSAWMLIACRRAMVLKTIALVVLVLLLIQIGLGISNVIWLLPLSSAVAHNGVAALLLLALVTMNYALYKISEKYSDYR